MEHPLALFRYCPKCGSARFVEHNQKSKHCEDCGFTYYINPSAATVAFILKGRAGGESLLVVRRGKEPAKGTLDLPGGFSDLYETSEEGVCREVLEETGMHIDIIPGFSGNSDYVIQNKIQKSVCIFVASTRDMQTKIQREEIEDYTWLPFNRAYDSLKFENDKAILAQARDFLQEKGLV